MKTQHLSSNTFIKKSFLLFFLIFSFESYAAKTPDTIEYALVFGTCFEKDIVSLRINNNLIFKNYKLGFEKALRKGNLSLKQTDKFITVCYNGEEKNRARIKSGSVLKIEIILNGKTTGFTIDLRKGNILFIESCNTEERSLIAKKLTIEQRQEAVILM